jgi:hypothetical protein
MGHRSGSARRRTLGARISQRGLPFHPGPISSLLPRKRIHGGQRRDRKANTITIFVTDPTAEIPLIAGGRASRKSASKGVDLENLLHFCQRLYAHALTLQEIIRNGGEETYEMLSQRYRRQAAQQFEIFCRSFRVRQRHHPTSFALLT